MTDLNALDTNIDELIVAAEAEVDGWASLAARANNMATRFHQAEQSLQAANTVLQNASGPVPEDLDEMLSAQIEELRVALQQSATDMTLLAGRANDAFARLDSGDVDEGMRQLESAVSAVADTTVTALDELTDGVNETASQVLEELPERSAEATRSLSSELVVLGSAFDEEMSSVVTESIDEFEENLSEIVDESCGILNDACEALGEGVDSIVEDTQSRLANLGGEWRAKMSGLEESYTGLGEDLSQLGDDIRSTYSLVVDGMSSTGVGASAAGSVLTDVQALMSGVS